MYLTSVPDKTARSRTLLSTMIAVFFLVGAGYLLAKYHDGQEQREVASAEFNDIVVALRENRNRVEVYHMRGTVTTKTSTFGGWGEILHGQMTVKQRWSVAYFANMSDLTLKDYIWDAATRTLIVRAPAVAPDAPNIDESRQVVSYNGPIITRDMQNRLRQAIANGSKKQVSDEARKPENMAEATRAARTAIAQNVEGPLRAAGIRNFAIEVRIGEASGNRERWDVSRSIEDVLAERAARQTS